MPSITDLLRALGREQAVANVQRALDDRLREDWLVAGLSQRLDARDRFVSLDQARATVSMAASSDAA